MGNRLTSGMFPTAAPPPTDSPTVSWSDVKRPARFTLMGNDNVGKTTLLRWLACHPKQFTLHAWEQHVHHWTPKDGHHFYIFERGNVTITKFDLEFDHSRTVDVHEHEVARSQDGAIVMLDPRQDSSFLHVLAQHLDQLIRPPKAPSGMSLLILANFHDQTVKNPRSEEEIRQVIENKLERCPGKDPNLFVKAVNAKNGDGVVEAFEWLLKAVAVRDENRE